MRRDRTRIPILDSAREAASSGSGPVKTWKMSPEELEDYRARTGYKQPRNQDGEKISPPVQQRPNNKEAKKDMRTKEGPDKQAFLKMVAAGETIAAAEKKLGLKVNGMYYWLKKWNLIGITPGKAREALGLIEEGEAALLRSTSPAAQAIEERAKGPVALDPAPEKVIKELRNRITDYEHELARWAQTDTEKTLQITELMQDRDNWKQVAEQRKEEIDELDQFLREAKQAIRELEDDRNELIGRFKTGDSLTMRDPNSTYQALVEIGALQQAADNINHPAHYTAGGIETIDFIRAKLTPEEFIGYCKGNALKYVSRATHKGGAEDLRKAGKYLGWAVGGEVRESV